ncbi:MAG: hypothetical protein EA379_06750 [Phycisphaerales bacterium]|nr:MAG: hypothetical protein EA379_06750 [Phycisphaerales bacterium]
MPTRPLTSSRTARALRTAHLALLTGLALLVTPALADRVAPAAPAAPAATAQAPRLGSAEPAARTPGAIRVATYNVLNLFDDRDDPSLRGRFDDAGAAKPHEEKVALAEAIRRVDADVIALQEVESYDALIEFREHYIADMGYDYVVSIDVRDDRGIENSVLSRFPITYASVRLHLPLEGVHPELYGDQPNWYAGEPIVFKRTPLRVDVEVPAGHEGAAEPYALTLFVVHHKAGFHGAYWREREAEWLANHVREMTIADPSHRIAVVGDFNAQPHQQTVFSYTEAGLRDVFLARDSDDPALATHESGRVIDMILVNDALRADVLHESAFVLGTPLREEGADWRTTPKPPGYASDHLPVAVDITIIGR